MMIDRKGKQNEHREALPPIAVVMQWSVSVRIGMDVGHDVVEMGVVVRLRVPKVRVPVVMMDAVTTVSAIIRRPCSEKFLDF